MRCQVAARAAIDECMVSGDDADTFRDEVSVARGECLDVCGTAQSAKLDGCGEAFEPCLASCVPADEDAEVPAE
jgi:hypothetical protein